jgi:signal transduction histidine kinase/CheY-like chemotaxis protein
MQRFKSAFARFIPHWLSRSIAWINRPSGFLTLIIFIAFMCLNGFMLPFAPYDWLQTGITSYINSKPYKGDIVIVRYRDLSGSLGLSMEEQNRKYNEIIKDIDSKGPKRIALYGLPNSLQSKSDWAGLTKALENVQADIIVSVGMNVNMNDLSVWKKPDAEFKMFDNNRAEIAKKFVATQAQLFASNFGNELSTFAAKEINEIKIYPLPFVLANQTDEKAAKRKDVSLSDIYLFAKYDTESILKIQDSQLNGYADFSGKTILLSKSYPDAQAKGVRSFTGTFFIDEQIVSAAGDIADGPSRHIGWICAFGIGTIGCIIWIFAPRPYGRYFSLTIFIGLVVSPIWLEEVRIYQHTSNGVFLMLFVGIARARGRIKTSLKKARSDAATKSWLLAQASHDLRQPIHAIGLLTAQLNRTALSNSQAIIVGRIDRSVEAASRLFRSLLDVATLESGALLPKPETVRLQDIFDDIKELNFPALDMTNTRLRICSTDYAIKTDRALAITMVQNLVSNAIKYSSGKDILIGARRHKGRISLCVYDRGLGIMSDDLPNLTKAYVRGASASKIDGSGLGLAIVSAISDALNLTFEIKSKKGRGTSALIKGFEISDRLRSKTMGQNAPTYRPLNHKKVLLIDDDPDTLKVTADLLQLWGCDVDCHSTMPDCIAQCDIVVSDFDFGASGTLADCEDQIGQIQARLIPMIIVTGHARSNVDAAFGVNDFLILEKPVQPAQLRSALLSKIYGSGKIAV